MGGDTRMKWIKAEDPPKKSGWYSVFTNGFIAILFFCETTNTWGENHREWAGNVTHWMPLPEKPE